MTSPTDSRYASQWGLLLRAALLVLIVVAVLIHVYVQFIIPPVVVNVLLFVVALVLMAREGRARTVGIVIGGVSALLFTLGNLPFIAEDIAHPESSLAFIASCAGIIGSIAGFIAMLGLLLNWADGAARPIRLVASVALAAVVVLGIVSYLGVDDDAPESGDVVLVAEDVDYFIKGESVERDDETAVGVDSGGAVFIENKDLYRHTFVIEDLDIKEEVPAGANRRVVIDADPGEYEFICDVTGHDEDMRGTVSVR